MTLSLTFPGQGSQTIGMGKALADSYPAARAVFEEVDDALGEKLSDLMWSGTQEDLTLTRNAQPALMAASLAAIKVLESEGLDIASQVACVAGHSLGEYSALAAVGSLTISDAAKLLRIRGKAMQEAVPVGEGAMAVVLGLNLEAVREIADLAAQGAVCEVANDNSDIQVVVSGHKAAVERAIDVAKSKGAKRAMLLPVSAPFHCRLMAPAAEVMAEALSSVNVNAPIVPLVANVIAGPVTDPSAIRKNLVTQVSGSVRWRESMKWMLENDVSKQLEVGAGKVLTGLIRRMDKQIEAAAFGGPDDIEGAKALWV
ncbi:MAG: ACP S-malonyltransferase [Hyphomicrobiales bacterium]